MVSSTNQFVNVTLDTRTAHRRWWKRKGTAARDVVGVTKRSLASFTTLTVLTLGLPLFANTPPALAAAACPTGTTGVPFSWQGAAAGNQAVWNGGDNGYSQSYTFGTGATQVTMTMAISDPLNRNVDANHLFLTAPWKTTNLFGSIGGVTTKSNGAYGAGFLTFGIGTLNSGEGATLNMSFNRPVVIKDVNVGDIDFSGYKGTAMSINNDPEQSFQDQVELRTQRGGVDIPYTVTPLAAGKVTTAGQITKAKYVKGVGGDLNPADPLGTVAVNTVDPINSFTIAYTNGPDDAAAERLPSADRKSYIPAGNYGVSDSQAVRVSGFTVCVGTGSIGDSVYLDNDRDGFQNSTEKGIAGVTVQAKDPQGNVVATAVTDANGKYVFPQLPPYTYTVAVVPSTLPASVLPVPTGDPDPTKDGVATVPVTGAAVANVDFGYAPTRIAGFVYEDTNDDGVVAAGESKIRNTTLELVNAVGTVVATTTTATDGSYEFAGFAPGTYTVRELQPVGYIDAKDTAGTNGSAIAASGNDAFTVTVAAGQQSIDNNFGELRGGSISGKVYVDGNDDGDVAVTGEPAIGGVVVRLLNAAGNEVANTITAADGTYTFNGVAPGSYTVQEVQPSTHIDGIDTPGTNATAGSINDTVAVTLPSGGSSTGNNFGERGGSIAGVVFHDSANGGVNDATDPKISGVSVALVNLVTGATIATTTTNSSGAYLFTNLAAGNYIVVETQAAGFGDSVELPGVGNTTSSNDRIAVELSAGESTTNNDFAEVLGVITGSVYVDANNSGARNGAEAGIGGIAIQLLDASGSVVASATTDSTGAYSFTNLAPGSYRVVEPTQPAGYIDGAEAPGTGGATSTVNDKFAVTLSPASMSSTGNDFGERTPVGTASISGTVFQETNNTGVQGAGEPGIVGVTVELLDSNGNVLNTTLTDTNGDYSFTALPSGNYKVREVQPTTHTDGRDRIGAAADSAINDLHSVTVTTGAVTDVNFAELPPSTSFINGFVYAEESGNTSKDAGDSPLAGVSVRLLDSVGGLYAVATTDALGAYSFNVPAGTYTVVEVQPTSHSDGTETTGTGGTSETIPASTNDQIRVVVGNNVTSAGNNFGEVPGSISGVVFVDTDGNGAHAGVGTEPIVGGVTVNLLDAAGAIVASTTTNATTGAYSFTKLPAGSYTVVEVQPGAYGDGAEVPGTGNTTPSNDRIAVNLAGGENSIANNFGETPGVVSGSIYVDTDKGGSKNGTETGFAGVTVNLLDAANVIVATTPTTSDGGYSFTNLKAGSYHVEEVQPAGYVDATETAGTYANVSSTNDRIDVELPAGGKSPANNFGEVASIPGAISGYVYADRNGDGVRDSADGSLGNVTVQLVDSTGAVIASAVTNATGAYSFPNVAAGTYRVREVQPTGFTDATETPGTGTATAGSVSAPDEITVVLANGETSAANNFGEVGARLAGHVYSETDNSGTLDPGEPAIPGVTVTLKNAAGATIATTATAADGTYSFEDLAAGSYTVVETQPAGFADAKEHPGSGSTSSPANDQIAVTLAAGGQSVNNDFAEAPPAQAPVRISGSVYADRDNDGVLDSGEVPLPGTTVTLLNANGTVVATTTANATGAYEFSVPAGTYTVVESQPVNYSDGRDTPGTQGALATGNDRFTVTLSPSETSTGNNFGERPARISGSVFVDANDGGSRDVSEVSIPGVTVELRNAANTVIATTITAADGTYAFEDLPAGSYKVVEAQPAAFSDGKDHLGTGTTTAGANDEINVTLPAGGSSISNDFGELPPPSPTGTISGIVYTEVDGTPGFTGTDTGLGTTLTLIDANGTVIATTTSDPTTGAYAFPNMPGGSYTVVESQPTGVLDGVETPGTAAAIPPSTNDRIAVTLTPGTSSPGNNFGELPPAPSPATISGSVFVDSDAGGDKDAGEPAIAGVTVILLDTAGTEVSRTTTAVDGTYSFSGLPAGTYTVVEQQPTKFADGAEIPGTNGATTPNNDRFSVTVAAGQSSTTNDFAELGGTVRGQTFVDTNGTGGRTTGEPVLSGVVVRLVDAAATVVGTTTTGADGSYVFTNLPAGNYRVEETQPSTHADGAEYPGSGATSSPANDTIAISLPAGGNSVGNDFGEQPLVAPTGSITGAVYVDAGDDGVKATGETPINGVAVQLLDGTGAVVATTTTGPDGSYVFANIPGGTYTVVELQPTGYTDGKETPGTGATSTTVNERINVVLPVGGSSTGNNFGEQPTVAPLTGAISGYVYVDSNDDGARTGETGINGTSVKLVAPDGTVVATTTTGIDGSYAFPNIPAGTYRIEESQPASNLDGKDTPGTGGTAGTTNDTLVVTLAAGGTSTENNFGEQPQVTGGATISGNVFREVDGAPGKGATDTPIASVIVRLLSTSGAEVARTATLPDGTYTFSGLPAGSYVVVEEQPAGLPDTTDYAGTGTTLLAGNDRIAVTVAAGGTSTGNDFSELAPLIGTATIRGAVFGDSDGNGVKAPVEPGIGGVVVRLVDGSGNVVSTTTTAPNGTYAFVNVPAGSYTIEEAQPTGWNDGTDTPGVGATPSGNDKFAVVVANGATLIENNFAEVGALIKGSVFVDSNDDGINGGTAGNEAPIAGVTVQLLDSNGSLIATTTSDTSGTYQFGPLPTGTYTIVETQPTAFNDGKEHPGVGGNVGTTNDQIIAAVTAGTPSTAHDFGEREKTPPSLITGTVYRDRSENGALDSDDPGVEGVTVQLLDAAGTVVASVITGPSGVYDFPEVPAGVYFIVERQPELYVDGADTPGGLATSVANDRLKVTVANGQTSAGNNFGELAKPGTIGGRVFVDLNNDGTMNDGTGGTPKEVPLSGVTVQLQDPTGRIVATTVTAADGTYQFLNVAPGNYRIVELQPTTALDGIDKPGLNNTSTVNDRIDLYLADGDSSIDNDFAEIASQPLNTPGRISGTVAVDTNNDGRADVSETGIAGVTIELVDPSGTVVRTTVTGADGSYLFVDVVPGTYVVREVQPVTFGDGKDAPGFNGATAGGNDTFSVTLAPGTWSHSNDFGEGHGAILGSVVVDRNDDGIPDGPIDNVTIELLDDAGTVVRTTTTKPDGSFSFTGLGAGSYRVRERQPVGYLDGSDTPGDSGTAFGNDEIVVTLTNTSNASGIRFMEKQIPIPVRVVQVRPDVLTPAPEMPLTPVPAPVVPSAPPVVQPLPSQPVAPAIGNKVSGKVWLDSNRDAANGSAETGVAAVELRIYDKSGTLVATTQTKADGTWTIDLPAGDYEIEPVVPAGFNPTTITRVKFSVVNGEVIVASPIGIVPEAQAPAELALAFTGAPVKGLLRDGGVLIMSGFVLVAITRRRRRPTNK